MKIITLEEHFTDQRIIDENNKYHTQTPPASPEEGKIMQEFVKRVYPGKSLLDFEDRLKFMDENRIDMQVLSWTSPISDEVPKEEAVRICRMANDITKSHIDAHPDRFAGFATLPMADPAAAAEELERSVTELGLSGALLAGNYKGRYYNEAEFFPIFEKAAELDVPLSFHPAFVPQPVQSSWFDSDAYSKIVALEFGSAGFGWHLDTGIQIARLILSGIFDKLPGLKFISGHWGETIPCFLERMDAILTQDITGLEKPFSAYYKEHVYITPSGILSSDQLHYLVHVMGADHLLYAADYPYVKIEHFYEFLTESGLPQEDIEKIAYKNAEQLLKIKA